MKLAHDQIEDLRRAARELDALWDLQAQLGLHDNRGGTEYDRCSAAPLLRRLAKETK